MKTSTWDTIVIGGGPAGLSAALMLGRSRRRVLVLDTAEPRNRFADHMHGVLGHEGATPADLAVRGRGEVEQYGVIVHGDSAELVRSTERGIEVSLRAGEPQHARSLVVASGATDELPQIRGIAQHWGSSVLHCPYCHGWEVKDRRLGLLMVSPAGWHHAQLVRQLSEAVTVFLSAGVELDADLQSQLKARGVTVVTSEVTEVLGTAPELTGVKTADGATVELDALFVATPAHPNDAFLRGLELRVSEGPMGTLIEADSVGQTSDARIWAVGNVVTPYANVPLSMGMGSMTGAAVNAFLTGADFDRAAAEASASEPQREVEPVMFWNNRYSENGRVWSGNPNRTLVTALDELHPGTAIDLGCGEGADALWLAGQGWTVTGVDISLVAVERAREAAREIGISPRRIAFTVADLAKWNPPTAVDLVTASFLHAPVELPRIDILRRAASWVSPGGHLLILGHAAAPPWARAFDPHRHRFFTAAEDLEKLELDLSEWTVLIAEERSREATSPSGAQALLDDSVLLLRRR
ncbi:bifunctional NAD(P)/FAD-dependent oxidoreductase/class I SAM-dependent methyltransferase [Microbacterium sp. NPDC076911]|uniref:bifunctional NAD(P)/FAD-dependent oxidoreductase/class I SAM-dependent methyltransferase n=1 Tax=Microbacterium sp. NPDC076911 TaxID=3154958 RepID=UPI0034292153